MTSWQLSDSLDSQSKSSFIFENQGYGRDITSQSKSITISIRMHWSNLIPCRQPKPKFTRKDTIHLRENAQGYLVKPKIYYDSLGKSNHHWTLISQKIFNKFFKESQILWNCEEWYKHKGLYHCASSPQTTVMNFLKKLNLSMYPWITHVKEASEKESFLENLLWLR